MKISAYALHYSDGTMVTDCTPIAAHALHAGCAVSPLVSLHEVLTTLHAARASATDAHAALDLLEANIRGTLEGTSL